MNAGFYSFRAQVKSKSLLRLRGQTCHWDVILGLKYYSSVHINKSQVLHNLRRPGVPQNQSF